MSEQLRWSGEQPYHVARFGKRKHYSIERVDSAVTYFELKGTGIWPPRKFLTLRDAKHAAQVHYDQTEGK